MSELELAGLRVVRGERGTHVSLRSVGEGVAEVLASAADGLPRVVVEVDLADAIGYWSPRQGASALPADWMPPTVTSVVSSAPLGVLYNSAGDVLVGFAASEAVAELSIRAGVSEERKAFVIDIEPSRPLPGELVVLVDCSGSEFGATISQLSRWVSGRCEGRVADVPEVARIPVYSTWYTFARDIDEDVVLSEASLAGEIGCGSVFIDDGWQRLASGRDYRGCGDWVPDEAKFSDLTRTVAALRDRDLSVALWVAPLLLGDLSDTYPRLSRFAPHWSSELSCHVMDPRHPEVRAHVTQTCLRLVRDYHVDLLKIDFLDQAMAYRDSATAGDQADVGQAMNQMLTDLRRGLGEIGRNEVAFEFRQPYVSPAIARYGQILRANDCPGDAIVNRRSVIDLRLLAVGQVIHSDPLMWGLRGDQEAVAQQLYAAWFSVPQISMRLESLPRVQFEVLRGLLRLWLDHSEVTQHGHLDTLGPEQGHLLVSATRADLQRKVMVSYAPLTIDLDHRPVTETSIINACRASRIAVRTSRRITTGVTRSAQGKVIAAIPPCGPGLVDIAIPPFGSITVFTETARGTTQELRDAVKAAREAGPH